MMTAGVKQKACVTDRGHRVWQTWKAWQKAVTGWIMGNVRSSILYAWPILGLNVVPKLVICQRCCDTVLAIHVIRTASWQYWISSRAGQYGQKCYRNKNISYHSISIIITIYVKSLFLSGLKADFCYWVKVEETRWFIVGLNFSLWSEQTLNAKQWIQNSYDKIF